ncbi:DNA transposase THAP9 [Armadillidium vulgare]|nr:DNA transposase THAP9 [Armadillidium vulgare]
MIMLLIFPLTNKKLTKIWVMKMKRGKFYPSKFSKICSDHFTPDCINPGVGFGKPTLKPNAIPTIFNFSPSSKVTSISDPSQNFEEISQTQEIGAFEEVALTSEEIFPAMDVVTPKLTSKNNKEIFHSVIINDHSYDISLQAKLTKAKLEIKRLKNKCSAYQNFIKNSKSKEYVGGIDLGHGNLTNDDREHDQSIMANEALFFMGVAVNASFKIPLGSFDILNSRSPFAKGFKSALFPHIDKWRCWINESLEYLTNLNDKSGSFLCGGKKKVGFLGFYVCLKSLLMLADELLYGENPPLKYIMSYKFSQDSIEIFFSIIRSRLGNNNNPTPLQLRHCLRKILIGRINYSFEGGNCLDFRDSSLPEFKPLAGEKNEIYTFDHSYINEYETLTLVCDNIVSYISGFIVRKLSKSIKCVSCIAALTNENSVSPYMSLINIKNKGGLVLPSQDVIKTCRWCEKVIRQEVGVSPSFRKNIKSYLMYSVMQYLSFESMFPSLQEHAKNNSIDENHICLLIKNIISAYLDVRLHYIGKEYSISQKGTSVREKYNKLILFRGF